MTTTIALEPDTPTRLVRNIAARGLVRTFTLRLERPVGGLVEVRSGPLPFFLGASRHALPLSDGLQVKRKFFDASFEVVVTADEAVQVWFG